MNKYNDCSEFVNCIVTGMTANGNRFSDWDGIRNKYRNYWNGIGNVNHLMEWEGMRGY